VKLNLSRSQKGKEDARVVCGGGGGKKKKARGGAACPNPKSCNLAKYGQV